MPQTDTFRTSDGYTLHRTVEPQSGLIFWTDGDLEFPSDKDGNPISYFDGALLEGEYL